MPERAVDIAHDDARRRSLAGRFQHHARGENLADHLVADGHIGGERGIARVIFRAAADDEAFAHRHEFGVTLDIRDEIEHRLRRMPNRARGFETGHQAPVFAARAAFSFAKSSPAWCDERVSGLEDTIAKPLV